MPYVCELDDEDISYYLGLISTEMLMESKEKQNVLDAYAHFLECYKCKECYDNFRGEIYVRRDSSEPVIFKGIYIDFELLSQNEKTIEAMFRN